MLGETYMNNKDFILARNSGIPPVKLLLDKSLKFVRIKNDLHVSIYLPFEVTIIILTNFQDG